MKKTKYGIDIDFLSLKHIEKGIKIIFRRYENVNTEDIHDITQHTNPYIKSIIKDKKGSQTIYRNIQTKYCCRYIETKWQNEGYNTLDLEQAYLKLQKSLTCPRLRWFQLRIINRILTTNKSVAKYKLNQSPLCVFCKETEETIDHLFYECRKVKYFWKEIENEISQKCPNLKIKTLPKSLILFGTEPNFMSNPAFDMLIVMAKLYIYRQKVKDQPLYYNAFIKELTHEYKCEKYNATIMSREQSFRSKWLNVLPLIEHDVIN